MFISLAHLIQSPSLIGLSPSMRVTKTTAILFLHFEQSIFGFIYYKNILSSQVVSFLTMVLIID